MTGRDAAEVIAAVLCAEVHPDSTWVCDPEAADPRNRIPACYACQRGAAALVAEGIGVLAEAKAEALREAADHWQRGLRRDAALYDYGRWIDAAANMLRDRADRIEATP
jgi:hypothetical protein